MHKLLGLNLLSSFAALGVATCCVLPMVLMLPGLGGSWFALFGTIAAVSYPVLVISLVLVAASWVIAIANQLLGRFKWWLFGTTATTVLTWVIVINETRTNDYLIMQM